MKFKQHLNLIKIVHDNYSHIQDLEILGEMYRDMEETEYSKQYPSEYQLTQFQIDKLYVICKTTQNSHYGFGLFLSPEFQDSNNHIDIILEKLQDLQNESELNALENQSVEC
jgi:hypothetical protein